jgi:CheY-like chemotaxis protein
LPSESPLILVVDDQAEVRFMLSLFLGDENLAHQEAASGAEALERMAARAYDVVVLDQRMPPGLSGIEVAERLRSEGDETPIVIYSAYLEPDVERRARALGLETVDKGSPERLIAAIRAALASADQ